ncbi:uncharacterized protein [Phyllobates terribilis]|uniref:uncharacterized protein n=1 Tax=Phyllobates terribilis TaxID=111132 RepID=UPI003CCB1C55
MDFSSAVYATESGLNPLIYGLSYTLFCFVFFHLTQRGHVCFSCETCMSLWLIINQQKENLRTCVLSLPPGEPSESSCHNARFLDADMEEECHAATQCLMAETQCETVSGGSHVNFELAEDPQYPDSQELLTESQQLDAEVMAESSQDKSRTLDIHSIPMCESFIDCTVSDDDRPSATTSDDEACTQQPVYSFTDRDIWSPKYLSTSTEETIIDLTGSDDETEDKENASPLGTGTRTEENYTHPSTCYSSPTQLLWRPINLSYAPRKTARRQAFITIFEKKEFEHRPPLEHLWKQPTQLKEVNPPHP